MFKFKLLNVIFILGLLLVIAGTLWSYMALKNVGEELIIHFNNYDRKTQSGDILDLIGVGFIAVVMNIVNFFIAVKLEERDWFWGKLAAAATAFFDILIFIGFTAIINAN